MNLGQTQVSTNVYDNRTKGYKTEKNLKMYNHTCDIADELGLGDNWVRKCPPGVKSCFWAEGAYDKQSKFIEYL